MQFQRLRLTGFKSFVEPTEFRIEPGLTGVVGPNGCGKSNLLEALRWVMGANSAKAMRAEGMDDVIFGGAVGRPARSHAEVLLQIDNAERTAPAQFNDSPVIEVTRRIDRGVGSTYRVNGVETRAKDVQLLFADASTGANSPSLVRQGQISELIAAKPANRRRILEEAAGVSGLHSRRHEADLRLKAAEANLIRLDDVAAELEASLARLKREARQAERYKRIAAEIRALQGAVLFARWREAETAHQAAAAETAAAGEAVETAAREAARAAAALAAASEALPSLRQEEVVAAAVLQRVAIDRDRAEREAALAQAEVERLRGELARIAADLGREGQALDDARGTESRLAKDLAEVDAAIAAAPERAPALKRGLDAATAARAAADAGVERLAVALAAAEARREAAAEARARTEAHRRTALVRLEEAKGRLARTRRALETAETERAALAQATSPEEDAARRAFAAAEVERDRAKAALTTGETERARAATAEAKAREAARAAEDALRRLRTEADGLTRLLSAPAGPDAQFPSALDAVTPERGLEAALAAALGDDLDAALDARAARHWGGAAAPEPVWPEGATPLSKLVQAPEPLRARLAMTALVGQSAGAALQKALPPGARLVSREGDLWRWDGFVARAAAPTPAAQRLAQKARLAEAAAAIDAAAPEAAALAAAFADAGKALAAAEDALRTLRRAPEAAERALAHAREQVERHARDAARREARAQSLGETIDRFAAEAVEAEAAVTAAEAEVAAAPEAAAPDAETGPDPKLSADLAAARRAAAEARDFESRARATLDQEQRASEGRLRRRDGLTRDRADWTRRAAAAAARLTALDKERISADAALAAAREAPDVIEQRRLALADELAAAEMRRTKAADALAAAETASAAADRAARAADQAASTAREARAASTARLDAAAVRAGELAEQIRQSTRLEPEALGTRLAEEATAIPADAQGVEKHLVQLEQQRDALGAVNLLAEQEAGERGARLQTLQAERADLIGAVAKLRAAIETLNGEGRERVLAAFAVINEGFKALFRTLFEGGEAELKLVESDDPLEAGLEIFACPPGKRMAVLSLMSGGEQALVATALIFAVFLANPSPICVLDEVDAPLDDANVDRFCSLLDEMRRRTDTRFLAITHNPVTMSRVDRLYGVTMAERGVSQLVSVDLRQAEALAAE